MMSHQLSTICKYIQTNNIRYMCTLLNYYTPTWNDLQHILGVCVMENRPLALHHMSRYVDQYNHDVSNIDILRLAVMESKKEIVEYLLNVHCVGTPTMKYTCTRQNNCSDVILRIIHNQWDYIYCNYMNQQPLTDDDFLQAITVLTDRENGNVMFTSMLQGNVNYPLVCRYLNNIVDKLYGKKRMSMFKTLIHYLNTKKHNFDVSKFILDAVQIDNHDALHTLLDTCSKLHVDYCIGKYTLLQWSIMFGSTQCFVFLKNRCAKFDNSSTTLELLSNCQHCDLLDMVPWQELMSTTITINEFLHFACSHENHCVIKHLSDTNVASLKYSDPSTPLCSLIFKPLQNSKNLESVQLLIKLGASLDDVPDYLLQKCFYKNTIATLKKLLFIDDPNRIRGIDYYNCKTALKPALLPISVDIVRHIGSFLDATFFSPHKSMRLLGQINTDCDCYSLIHQYLSLYSMQSI